MKWLTENITEYQMLLEEIFKNLFFERDSLKNMLSLMTSWVWGLLFILKTGNHLFSSVNREEPFPHTDLWSKTFYLNHKYLQYIHNQVIQALKFTAWRTNHDCK